MKLSLLKLILFGLWSVGMLLSFQESPVINNLAQNLQELKFRENHSTWPMLANRVVTDLIDHKLPSYRPWPDIPECAHFKNNFAVASSFIPPVYLTSFPGSGNTWTRYLVESVTGFFTFGIDTMYPEMIMRGFYGNTLKYERGGQTVLVKTHSYNNKIIQNAVVLLRNPFESIICYRKLETVGKTENPDEATAFHVTKWREFKQKEIGSWFRHSMSFLKLQTFRKHFIIYDELVMNTRQELLGLLQFLDIPFDNARLDCVMANMKGHYKRKKSMDKLTFPFTKNETQALETATCITNTHLERLNLTTFRLNQFTQTMKKMYDDPDSLIPDPFCATIPKDEHEAVARVKPFLSFFH